MEEREDSDSSAHEPINLGLKLNQACLRSEMTDGSIFGIEEMTEFSRSTSAGARRDLWAIARHACEIMQDLLRRILMPMVQLLYADLPLLYSSEVPSSTAGGVLRGSSTAGPQSDADGAENNEYPSKRFVAVENGPFDQLLSAMDKTNLQTLLHEFRVHTVRETELTPFQGDIQRFVAAHMEGGRYNLLENAVDHVEIDALKLIGRADIRSVEFFAFSPRTSGHEGGSRSRSSVLAVIAPAETALLRERLDVDNLAKIMDETDALLLSAIREEDSEELRGLLGRRPAFLAPETPADVVANTGISDGVPSDDLLLCAPGISSPILPLPAAGDKIYISPTRIPRGTQCLVCGELCGGVGDG